MGSIKSFCKLAIGEISNTFPFSKLPVCDRSSAGDWDPQVFEVLKYLQVGDLASADGSGGGIRFLIKRIAEVRMPHLHLEPMRFPFGESVTTNQGPLPTIFQTTA